MNNFIDNLKLTLKELNKMNIPTRYIHIIHRAIHSISSIEKLHTPYDKTGCKHQFCEECDQEWPCSTYRAINSERNSHE